MSSYHSGSPYTTMSSYTSGILDAVHIPLSSKEVTFGFYYNWVKYDDKLIWISSHILDRYTLRSVHWVCERRLHALYSPLKVGLTPVDLRQSQVLLGAWFNMTATVFINDFVKGMFLYRSSSKAILIYVWLVSLSVQSLRIQVRIYSHFRDRVRQR